MGPPHLVRHRRATEQRSISKTIMLIHGAWLNEQSWEGFKARYEARGYTTIVPSWPLDDRSPAELRASPNPTLARIGINGIIDYYDRPHPLSARVADPDWTLVWRRLCAAPA
jgi:hypothetical protein